MAGAGQEVPAPLLAFVRGRPGARGGAMHQAWPAECGAACAALSGCPCPPLAFSAAERGSAGSVRSASHRASPAAKQSLSFFFTHALCVLLTLERAGRLAVLSLWPSLPAPSPGCLLALARPGPDGQPIAKPAHLSGWRELLPQAHAACRLLLASPCCLAGWRQRFGSSKALGGARAAALSHASCARSQHLQLAFCMGEG